MTMTDLQAYRKRLQSLAERLRAGTHGLRDEVPPRSAGGEPGGGEPTEAPIDSGELAAHLSAEDVVLSVTENEERLLGEVEAALRRIDNETFGACCTCGKTVSRERLRALPYARDCMYCARSRAETATA